MRKKKEEVSDLQEQEEEDSFSISQHGSYLAYCVFAIPLAIIVIVLMTLGFIKAVVYWTVKKVVPST